MKVYSIIFSGLMIDALRAGRKTQTRRYAWITYGNDDAEGHPSIWQKVKKGDRVWVREACYIFGKWVRKGFTKTGRPKWTFKTTNRKVRFDKPQPHEMARRGTRGCGWTYRHARYMARWMSRLTLVITAARVEDLREISRADAAAEGICLPEGYAKMPAWYRQDRWPEENFGALWDSLHGMGAFATNPEVVVMSFKVRRANIDNMKRRKKDA